MLGAPGLLRMGCCVGGRVVENREVAAVNSWGLEASCFVTLCGARLGAGGSKSQPLAEEHVDCR